MPCGRCKKMVELPEGWRSLSISGKIDLLLQCYEDDMLDLMIQAERAREERDAFAYQLALAVSEGNAYGRPPLSIREHPAYQQALVESGYENQWSPVVESNDE